MIRSEGVYDFPRIRDLPQEEQGDFDRWLDGQTRPLIDGIPLEEQDFYYPWDYDRWKKGLPIID